MASGNAFRVDTLVTSLKELQQEKSCLEQKLNELRSKRQNLEGVLKTVNTKQSQVKDTNLKMMETLKVAQHKVIQTQTQANSLENSNVEKRSTIDSLNEKIAQQKQTQLEEIKEFEANLREISLNLNEAKYFFKDSNLEDEIQNTNGKISETVEEVEKSHSKVNDLEKEVSKLSLNESGGGDCTMYGVPLDDRKEIWQMLLDENNSSIKCLNNLEDHLKDLACRLQGQE